MALRSGSSGASSPRSCSAGSRCWSTSTRSPCRATCCVSLALVATAVTLVQRAGEPDDGALVRPVSPEISRHAAGGGRADGDRPGHRHRGDGGRSPRRRRGRPNASTSPSRPRPASTASPCSTAIAAMVVLGLRLRRRPAERPSSPSGCRRGSSWRCSRARSATSSTSATSRRCSWASTWPARRSCGPPPSPSSCARARCAAEEVELRASLTGGRRRRADLIATAGAVRARPGAGAHRQPVRYSLSTQSGAIRPQPHEGENNYMQRSSLRRVGALTFGVSMVVMAAGTVGARPRLRPTPAGTAPAGSAPTGSEPAHECGYAPSDVTDGALAGFAGTTPAGELTPDFFARLWASTPISRTSTTRPRRTTRS